MLLKIAGGTLAAMGLMTAAAYAQSSQNFNRIATFPVAANLPADRDAASETVAEIIAATADGMMLAYTDSEQGALGLIDISDAGAPKPAGFVPLDGEPTSVAVAGGNALVGVVDGDSTYTEPAGHLAIVDLAAKSVAATCDLGGQPDSVALSPDGATLAVVLENERDEDLNDGIIPQLPSGALAVFPVSNGVPDCGAMNVVDLAGLAEIAGSDAELEFVDINEAGQAIVTLQENNHLAVVDLASGSVTAHYSAGAVNLTAIDTEDDRVIAPVNTQENRKREPDAVQWVDDERFVTANEGDYEGGSRGFTIFDMSGAVLWDSGSAMEHLAIRIGHYPDKRSDAKGTEPEGMEVGTFGDDRLIFVGAERASFVAVYRDTGADPEFLQVLPTGVGPEGLLAIPSRNLFVVANEVDLIEDGGARSTVMIYERGDGPPRYPQIQSAAESGIAWGALSGVAADPSEPGKLYAVIDSFYAQAQILTIDATKSPAEIVASVTVTENGAPMPNIDLEGIAIRTDGGFWLASEGRPKDDRPNRLIRVAADGAVQEVVVLPDSIVADATNSGLEGVAVVGSGDAETVWAVQQRPWKDDPEGTVKLIAYTPATQEWGIVRYPLETPEKGWIGLSEITLLPDGSFAIIERDNQLGEDAKVKRLYSVSLAGVTPVAPGLDAPVAEKSLLRDLMPDLASANGYVVDKVESFALDAAGSAYIITDNDGVDDASGETLFLKIDLSLSN